jgi:hypothetical protein
MVNGTHVKGNTRRAFFIMLGETLTTGVKNLPCVTIYVVPLKKQFSFIYTLNLLSNFILKYL